MPDLKLVPALLPDAIDRAAERAIEQIMGEAERLKEDLAVVAEVQQVATVGQLQIESSDAAAVIDFQLWTPTTQIQLSLAGAGGYVQLQSPMEPGKWRAVLLLFRKGDR